MMRKILIILVMILACACSNGGGDPVSNGVDDPVSSPARWTQTPSTIPMVAGRQEAALNRVGCFQKIALEHEDGRTFIVCATESAAAPGTVLRLAVSESVNTDKTWAGGAGDYAAPVETTIANGYDADSITNLREWSADIRGDTIFIIIIRTIMAAYNVEIIRYDIDAQTYASITYIPPALNLLAVSCDISCSESGCLRDINKRDVGHGSFWASFIDTGNFDPSAAQTYHLAFYEFIEAFRANPIAAGYGNLAAYSVSQRGGLSIFDGGNSIYSAHGFNPSEADNGYELRILDELQDTITDLIVPYGHLYYPTSISGASEASLHIYNFNCWDACYIDKYNYQVQAKWIRNSGNTGWDLYIGRRNQNGVFNAQLVKTVDYAHLGVTDIETELENIGTFPEVVLSVDEQGFVYCIFMFPDQTNNTFSGTGLGYLTGYPYTKIELMTMDGDEIYDPQNLDIQSVWDGFQDATYRSLKHLSASHRTDTQDFDVPADRRIWCSVREPISSTRIVLYRN